jgi:hypothetical protein
MTQDLKKGKRIFNVYIINPAVDIDLLSYREKQQLSLRKESIMKEIMEKRLGKNKKEIDPAKLQIDPGLSDYFEESNCKLELILKWMKGDNVVLKQFAFYHLRKISDEYEPEEGYDIDLGADFKHELLLNFFDTDITKMPNFTTVKIEISNIIMRLTYKSENFTKYLGDLDYVFKFCSLTYDFENSPELVENIIIIVGNILLDSDFKMIDFVTNVPIALRLQELYQKFKDYPTIRYHIYWLTCLILEKVDIDYYGIVIFFNLVRMPYPRLCKLRRVE